MGFSAKITQRWVILATVVLAASGAFAQDELGDVQQEVVEQHGIDMALRMLHDGLMRQNTARVDAEQKLAELLASLHAGDMTPQSQQTIDLIYLQRRRNTVMMTIERFQEDLLKSLLLEAYKSDDVYRHAANKVVPATTAFFTGTATLAGLALRKTIADTRREALLLGSMRTAQARGEAVAEMALARSRGVAMHFGEKVAGVAALAMIAYGIFEGLPALHAMNVRSEQHNRAIQEAWLRLRQEIAQPAAPIAGSDDEETAKLAAIALQFVGKTKAQLRELDDVNAQFAKVAAAMPHSVTVPEIPPLWNPLSVLGGKTVR